MQAASRQPYARATKATEDPVSFIKTANPNDPYWTPTVVNPAPSGNSTQKGLFWFHIFVWVLSIVFASISNFGVTGLQGKSNDTTACVEGANISSLSGIFCDDPSSAVKTVGMMGGISLILGVIALVGGAGMYDTENFRTMTGLNTIIQFLTLFGSVSTFFVFCVAAEKDSTAAFWLGLVATMLTCYAQVLLYCTSDTLDVLALPRAFLPAFAISVQIVSAISISDGAWHYMSVQNHGTNNFTKSQKLIAWMVPACLAISVLLMVALRRMTRDAVTEMSVLGDFPFLRSIVLMPFILSGVGSVYKLSFVKADENPVGFLFCTLGSFLTFSIISVVFVPSGMATNSKPTPNLRGGSRVAETTPA